MSTPPTPSLRSAAILLAGGSGNRMRGAVADKILACLAGKPVIAHSIAAFVASGAVQRLVVVCRDHEQETLIKPLIPPTLSSSFTRGGAERKDSVWAGLQACPPATEIVLIHDCARPCVTPQAIRVSIAAAAETGAACLARPVTDTLKSVSSSSSSPSSQQTAYQLATVDRSKLWAMETPQTFRRALILEAYQRIVAENRPITDDLSAIESLGQPVVFIDNQRPNPKLTTPADLPYLEFLLSQSV
ncbi:2-C-methyl-D-erythritol 4-phosphate cytidylyltransferase [Pelagicoccus sp. SDUM812003]|uniref:2-C-methyl-D-erythritol 4-phosphate cytidylyltransferase n=1 Tax=Pelagicoccus sp. SDUM812003 TaxID=3041267 RepID=UPI00280DC3CA|nr:2-C-methyl-D-erythritol 4-phosphate cytidylyltransferase [Pelagicoccus sp. SDUM812003]MDQ8203015.1 2-C-methyl-D-erythritol 4-phosphate cytidylyltransferase [Pelagicoccus sp. SDUM812003]